MTKNLPKECTLISDANAPDILEQPVIVADYYGGEGLSIIGYDGQEVYMPYRIVKEVTKQMIEYEKPKKKK